MDWWLSGANCHSNYQNASYLKTISQQIHAQGLR
jgi:hypothetical protein